VLAARGGVVRIPAGPWKELLALSAGDELQVEVYRKDSAGTWWRHAPLVIPVSTDPIEPWLVYRLLGPVYHLWGELGLFQRSLETHEERPLLVNRQVGNACINCHAFDARRPGHFSFHVRTGSDRTVRPGMILVEDGRARRLEPSIPGVARLPGYLSWLPGSTTAAWSINQIGQVIRSAMVEPRDVFDLASSIAVCDTATGTGVQPAPLSDPAWLSTFPAWAPDGRMLYFCRSRPPWGTNLNPPIPLLEKVRYDLVRIPYDPERRTWGELETLVPASATGLSASQPRVSPNGRFLLYCLSPWGAFPVNQPGSDLYLMDLRTRAAKRLALNSERAESWHSWSGNSRWIVFSSKRENGWLARPWFCHLDAEGRESRPFPLPQADPLERGREMTTYNLPELVSGPVTIPTRDLIRALRSSAPKPGGTEPAAHEFSRE
jgi:hypothetical protein